MDYRAKAREFVNEGFCHISVAEERITEAHECFTKIFSGLVPTEVAQGIRKGEKDPDLGLIKKTKDLGGDEKWFFHVASDMRQWLDMTATRALEAYREELRLLAHFKRHSRDCLTVLASEIEVELALQSGNLTGAIRSCSHKSTLYSVNTLRGLWYQSSPEQTGAKPHIDRNLITGHLGDQGGVLEACVDGVWQSVSPPVGQMLVFSGAKMLWLTNGRISPLKHRSTTVSGEDRRAMVFFSQADIGYYPHTAPEIVDEFYRLNPNIKK